MMYCLHMHLSYLHNKLPKNLVAENSNVYYMKYFVDQEIRHGSAESSGSRTLRSCNQGIFWGYNCLKAQQEVDLLSSWLR